MKKYLLFLMIAFIGLFVMSCDNRDDVINVPDNDTYSVVIDVKNVNFELKPEGYVISRTFNNPLYDSDVVLMYRQDGTTTGGSPVWQLIPRTLYLTNGEEVDYDFDFTKFDVKMYAGATYDLATTPEYLNNQTFRVVIIPASFKTTVDLKDYDAVIKAYNIDDSKPTKL